MLARSELIEMIVPSNGNFLGLEYAFVNVVTRAKPCPLAPEAPHMEFGIDAELAITRDSVDTFQKTLALFTRQFQGGVASKLEVERAQAALSEAAATVQLPYWATRGSVGTMHTFPRMLPGTLTL